MKNNLMLEIDDEVLELASGEIFKVVAISDADVEIKLSLVYSMPKKILIQEFLSKYEIIKLRSERDRMRQFIFQKDPAAVIIIAKGLCPVCHKKGRTQEWKFFRFAKVCPACDWVE